MNNPIVKRPDFFKFANWKPSARPMLALALTLLSAISIATFSGLAMAGTPPLPEEFKQYARGRMVLLDFYSAFCGTCQMMEPHLKSLEAKVIRDVIVQRVDLGSGEGSKYMSPFSIQGTPTYVLFNAQGQPLYRMDEKITPVILERQVMRLTGQLKTVHLPQEFPLPKPVVSSHPLEQMILLSFDSAKCKDCHTMTPYLHGFELAGRQGLQVVHLDTDTPAGKKLMDSWGIKTLPAYMLLDNSKAPVKSVSGDSRAELFRMAGKIEPRALWDLIRMFSDAGV